MSSPEDIRNDQMREGRTLSVREGYERPRAESRPHTDRRPSGGHRPTSDRRPSPPRNKPATPKGHDAILKDIQDAGDKIMVCPMSTDSAIVGTLVARDKFTITIVTEKGRQITLYKHAIESFERVSSAEQVQ